MIKDKDLEKLCSTGWKWRFDISRPTIRYIDVPFDISFIFDAANKNLDINKLKEVIYQKLVTFLDQTTIEKVSVIK